MIINSIFKNPIYKNLAKGNEKTIAIHNIAESHCPFLIAALYENSNHNIIVILNNDIQAKHMAEDIATFSKTDVSYIPKRDKNGINIVSSKESRWIRINSLLNITKNQKNIVCCSIEAACDFQCPKDILLRSCKKYKINDDIDPIDTLENLIKIGYERVSLVEGKGQCSLRGDILDVFSPSEDYPARIEFFDKNIDTIRSFDCITQRSINQLEEYNIVPASEGLADSENTVNIINRLSDCIISNNKDTLIDNESNLNRATEDFLDNNANDFEFNLEKTIAKLEQNIESLKNGYSFDQYSTWMNLLYDKYISINDYLDKCIYIVVNPDQVQKKQEQNLQDWYNYFEEQVLSGQMLNCQKEIMHSYDQFYKYCTSAEKVYIVSDFMKGTGKFVPETIVDINSSTILPYSSKIDLLNKDLQNYAKQGYLIYIYAGGIAREQRLEKSIEFNGQLQINKNLFINDLSINKGFNYPDDKLLVLSDADIFGTSFKKLRKYKKQGEKIDSYTELNVGSYVVHEQYGIGIYKGVVNVNANNSKKDYLLIEYANDDKLYVPIEQFDKVQKYASSDALKPSINSLGSKAWQKKKSSAKSKIKKLAFDLIKLYAQREQNKGYAYPKDSIWQEDFENDFPYELTIDQEKCINEIYSDMESYKIMDRLLCGDVGYGKTELAMRAAFKAISDGKQVALLAPTTVLAYQHYQTALKRFKHFPVNCELLTRFRSAKEQKDIINRLGEGKIDYIIGTHKLLGKSVVYKNLGLLIVDEEQRFGVSHKDIIKNYKNTVDVLTLSATPIPRTLHMSMIGIRDISVIQTPPEDRIPIKTYVLEFSNVLIKDAINKELQRGGQVYFLYNKVEDIDEMSKKLQALVPEARIGIAHGQMRENQLENTMLDFYSKKYDLLLCTTIIENGLDVASANTIIIYDADRFGLSQLYQLRGRVGRSSIQAFAYFCIRQNKQVSEIAQKRLNAIREFTEFGAGYRIAMRDLEIRGAGEIFGPEQSGHLSDLGYDMYLKLVEQTLNELQGNTIYKEDIDTKIDLSIDSYIPDEYIKTSKERIEIYKRISMIKDKESKMDIEEELIDRYGDIPEPVENLCLIAQLRVFTRKLSISRVHSSKDGTILLNIFEQNIKDPILLLESLVATNSKLKFRQAKPYGFSYTSKSDIKNIIKELTLDLETICKYIDVKLKHTDNNIILEKNKASQ